MRLSARALVFLALALPSTAQSVKLNDPLPPGIVGDVAEQRYSPNGQWVVIRAESVRDGAHELWSVPAAGGDAVHLNGPLANVFPFGSVQDFAISPDSSMVVYRAEQTVLKTELFGVPIGGGTAFKLNGTLGVNGDVASYAIAPDSSRVVYLANPLNSTRELFSVPLLGGPATRLNDTLPFGGSVSSSFRIAPDSSRVVYLADQATDNVEELWSVDIAGGPTVRLNGPLLGGSVFSFFAFSPDSSLVLYSAFQDVFPRIDLYAVPAAGGSTTLLSQGASSGLDQFDAFEVASDGSRAVFRSTTRDLYSAPLSGTGAVQLNPPLVGGGRVEDHHIAPDASVVVYRAEQDVDNLLELYAVPLAGGAATKLSPALPPAGDVAASPAFAITSDSARVVFSADAVSDQVFELYSAPLDPMVGGALKLNPTPVTGGDVLSFRLAPDGTQVVYRADQEVDEHYELYGVAIDGGAVWKVSSGSPELTTVAGAYELSPDGTMVAYGADANQAGATEALVAPSAGGASLTLSVPLASTPMAGDVTKSAISPDGRTVVYIADQVLDEHFELWAVPTAGGVPHRLHAPFLGDRDVTDFAFTPDGTRVVYLADQDTEGFAELYCVPLAGGATTKLSSGVLATSTGVQAFAVAPDGTKVVYTASTDATPGYPRWTELFSVPITGGPPTMLSEGAPNTPPRYVSPARFTISPDSVWVAFQEYYDDPPTKTNPYFDVLTVPIGGGSVSRVIDAQSYAFTFAFSADSSRLVVTADVDAGGFGLYSVAPGGGAVTRLDADMPGGSVPVYSVCPFSSCQGDPPTFTPSWVALSPDGATAVFTASLTSGAPRELFAAPVAGGPAVVLSPTSTSSVPDAFTMTPDGASVVFVGAGAQADLFVAPLTGGGAMQLNPVLPPGGSVRGKPVVSPDGTTVFYLAELATAGVVELWRVPLAGGASARLSPTPVGGGDVLELTLSPDGRFVVFLGDLLVDGEDQLFSVRAGGGPARLLSSGAPVPGGDVLTGTKVDPRSRFAVFLSDEDHDGTNELYSAHLTRERLLAPAPQPR